MDALQVGQGVIYTAPDGVDVEALVIHVWSPTCVNLVTVSWDEFWQDVWGRLPEWEGSVSHVTTGIGVSGWYWWQSGEARRE